MSTPGWYPAHDDPGAERYWDGTSWTDHVRPRQAAGDPAPTPATGSDWWSGEVPGPSPAPMAGAPTAGAPMAAAPAPQRPAHSLRGIALGAGSVLLVGALGLGGWLLVRDDGPSGDGDRAADSRRGPSADEGEGDADRDRGGDGADEADSADRTTTPDRSSDTAAPPDLDVTGADLAVALLDEDDVLRGYRDAWGAADDVIAIDAPEGCAGTGLDVRIQASASAAATHEPDEGDSSTIVESIVVLEESEDYVALLEGLIGCDDLPEPIGKVSDAGLGDVGVIISTTTDDGDDLWRGIVQLGEHTVVLDWWGPEASEDGLRDLLETAVARVEDELG